MSIEDKNIPQQHAGNQLDTQHEATLNTREEARQLFASAKNRLLNVSHGEKLPTVFHLPFS